MNTITVPKAKQINIGKKEIEILIQEKNKGALLKMNSENLQSPTSKFIDLFWFLNPKISNQTEINPNEFSLVIFSLNMAFGNIRVNGFTNIDSIRDGSLFLDYKNSKSINAAIYPAGMFQIINMPLNSTVKPIEQLLVKYNPDEKWQNELNSTKFSRSGMQNILMEIKTNNKIYNYSFDNDQYTMLIHAMNFALNQGQVLTGIYKQR